MKVRTSEVPARNLHYLTVNREYEVRDFVTNHRDDAAGYITLDDGSVGFILLKGCAYINHRDWEVIPE